MNCLLKIKNIHKDFIFHHQKGTKIIVLDDFSKDFFAGQASVLEGPSGVGKSTILRMIYAGYKTEKGKILVKHKRKFVDMTKVPPSMIYEIRQNTIGYVSQFLRVVPRVSALETVIEPLIARGTGRITALEKGKALLERLKIPENLWHISATTFSGGEQQRINLARGFIAQYPIMLLDEPTASLDPVNRQTVIELIKEAVAKQSCIIGIFHNKSDQEQIADNIINLSEKPQKEICA